MSDDRIVAALERIAVALEALGRAADRATPAGPVTISKRDFTNEELKTVSAPFKAVNQVILIKEVLEEDMKVSGIAELTKRDQQDRYLKFVRDKAALIPEEQRNAVYAAIDTLSKG